MSVLAVCISYDYDDVISYAHALCTTDLEPFICCELLAMCAPKMEALVQVLALAVALIDEVLINHSRIKCCEHLKGHAATQPRSDAT